MQNSRPIQFWQALLFWLKLGFISFGGPAGQIALMHKELVEKKQWISHQRFLHALNYCMLLPGPEAQQLATYLGWLMHKNKGGITAGVLFILPSFFILVLLSWLYITFGNTPLLSALFYGIKPAITVIVLQAAYRIGSKTLISPSLCGIAILSFILNFGFNLPYPFILIIAATLGSLGGHFFPKQFKTQTHSAKQHSTQTAWIDENSPNATHTQFSLSRFILIIILGMLLWFLPMSLLILTHTWQHTFSQMGWFFTKAALLTFGGAYAVLPYVYQGTVHSYGWLSPPQMMDGLALGETTPGPLIMIVTFIGFIGSYQLIDPHFSPLVNGLIGAFITTWFTFLPSFIFIFAGAPFIESSHKKLPFTHSLAAITACVVDIILTLALFWAYHVFWPQGFNHAISWLSVFIASIAAMLLFRFKIGIIPTIACCALLGLIHNF
jgi:chromate transporter